MYRSFKKFWESDFFWQPLLASIVLLVLLHSSIVFYRFVRTHAVSNATLNATSSLPAGVTPSSSEVFIDQIGYGWSDWSWNARSIRIDGQMQVTYEEKWGGFSLHSDFFNTEKLKSLAFAIYIPEDMIAEDAYIASSNLNGTLNPKQSIARYLPAKEFRKGVWYEVLVPLTDIGAADTKISGISFISPTPGTIIFDHIVFVAEESSVSAASDQ